MLSERSILWKILIERFYRSHNSKPIISALIQEETESIYQKSYFTIVPSRIDETRWGAGNNSKQTNKYLMKRKMFIVTKNKN